MLILGLETTCDETAAALVRDGRSVLSSVVSSQIELHAKFGGVVPEIASRAHLEQIHPIIAETLQQAGVAHPARDLDAVAVSHGPGLIGCLLIGVSTAKALAFAWQKPLIAVNHVQAHLYSTVLEDPARSSHQAPGGNPPASEGGAIENRKSKIENPLFPALGLVISGGHTSLYHVRGWSDLERIGLTHDDAVGEAFDKVAAILNLGYPGGPLIDQLAKQGDPGAVRFPLSLLEKDSLDFSFSGIKTAVLYHVCGKKGRERDASALSPQQRADVAASFQRAAATMLVEKLRRAAARYESHCILIGGGVSANTEIRRLVQNLGRQLQLPVHIPPLRYCTDNAAMVAGVAHPLLEAGQTADLAVEAIATM